jgi:ferrous iron transport protein B
MGLTKESVALKPLRQSCEVKLETDDEIVIALAGNPNTGKSTVFNALTGLNQHTGNWPGKTVTNALGRYTHDGERYVLVDLPGTYSLLANSAEEEVARDFICFGNPHATVVVADATCLERNLNLVLQILEITDRVVVCVNLMDEAKKKRIRIDLKQLSEQLGVPVVGTAARSGRGLPELLDAIKGVASGAIRTRPTRIPYDRAIEEAIEVVEPHIRELAGDNLPSQWAALRLIDGDEALLRSMDAYLGISLGKNAVLRQRLQDARDRLRKENSPVDTLRDAIVTQIVKRAEQIARSIVAYEDNTHSRLDRRLDDILTSRVFGIPIMLALLGVVFWLTIQGANYPSALLADGFSWIEDRLTELFLWLGTPPWVYGILVAGVYRTLSWVVSVMLPPMAIFFPLFTLLEDLGYLPRVAFNLDHFFKKACAHGKQALTMCMGFGCNAAGVIACRIINSPRERLIATITNNFVPCNGRFPTLIALATVFIAGMTGAFRSITATLAVLGTIVLGVMITLLISKLLSKTILKGLPSSFTLELPPYRRPQIGRVIVRSVLDRTLFVLGRAVAIAAPAGLVIWAMANITVGGGSLLAYCAGFLDPFGRLLGMDGYILMAFILGIPANEIVIPILIMSYTAQGSMLELDSLSALRQLFVDNGWTWLTAVCTMLFSLNHWPCATTLWTIRKETQSLRWTAVSFLVPTLTGIVLCLIVAQGARLLGLG